MSLTNASFHYKLAPLFEPSRYKVLYGGRGSMKSWGVARALLILGAQKTLRVLCVRELQASLDDSVHKLLSDQIYELGLQDVYKIEKAAIYGPVGTEFSFEGIRHNVQKIKSYEGIDICWVEEAQSVSKSSWSVLIPTIRKAGSEIWLTFNPYREKDETYQRFVMQTPPNSVKIFLNWRDNDWLSQELLAEKDYLQATDPDAYLNIWEGHCIANLEGAVYARELREAAISGRIADVPWDRTVGVNAYFDLGRRDLTSIWFTQKVAMQHRVLEYVEHRGVDFSYYIQLLQRKPYIYDEIGLPHDGKARVLGSKHTIEEQLRQHKFKVRVAPRLPVTTGISAVRSVFSNCWFDAKGTAKGRERLGDYHFNVDQDDKEFSVNPVHDENSHGADSFRTFAVLQRDIKILRVRTATEVGALPGVIGAARRGLARLSGGNVGWMR